MSEDAKSDVSRQDKIPKKVSGKVTLSLNATDRILFIDARGPFDEEFAHEYIRQITPFREALQPIAWGSLVTLKRGEDLLDDGSRKYLVSSVKGARQLGLVASVLVLERGTSKQEVEFWHSVYRDTGLQYNVVFDRAEALSFLTLTLQNGR